MRSFKPYGHRVKVRLLQVEELQKTTIFIPEQIASRQQEAVEKGVLVDKGKSAFKYIDGMEDEDIPLGSVVIFPAYIGRKYKGTDGHYYRVFEDQDIYSTEADEPEPTIGL
jgi:co-chaperonin GroES (HSP10)